MLSIPRSCLLCSLLLIPLATRTLAAALAPAKASDVVGLISGLVDCSVGGKLIGERILPTGGLVPFEIPPKHVFVMTSAEIEISGIGAGERVRATLFVETSPTVGSAVALADAVGGAGGIAIGSLTAPTGIIVARGSRLCVSSAGPAGAYVQGFFAKDK
jgi:hypothetical protein